GESGTAVGVDRRDCSPLVAQSLFRDLLQLRVDRDLERVARVRSSEQLVDEVLRRRRLASRQERVVRRLQPSASAEHRVGVVAGDVAEEVLLRIYASPWVILVVRRL